LVRFQSDNRPQAPAARELQASAVHKSDIPELVHDFLLHYSRKAKLGRREIRGLAPETLDALQRFHWPGNIRQLKNVMQSAVYQTANQILLPSDFAALFESNWPAIASNEVENGPAFDLIGSIEAMLQNAEKEIFGRITGRVEKELIVRTFATDIRTSESGERNPLIRRKTLRTRLRDLGIALDQIVTEGD
jgi:two-component system, NtrC family, nitrogen regulation response regulator GlnG